MFLAIYKLIAKNTKGNSLKDKHVIIFIFILNKSSNSKFIYNQIVWFFWSFE